MTKAVQKAVAAHTARLKAQGGSRTTLKLSPQATATLNRLAVIHGSRTKAIEFLLSEKS